MDAVNIIGRTYERKLIRQCAQSDKSELVAVYGRRRVGKTHLIKNSFDGHFDFWFTGIYGANRDVLMLQFRMELSKVSGKEYANFKDWFSAFEALKEYLTSLKKDTVLVFLDELPWMETKNSNFLPAFSYFWNMWSTSGMKLKLFVCGSSTTWMIDRLIGDKGGLYGRVTQSIYLHPFNLAETEEFLSLKKQMELNRVQILELYMILGGIPYYLDMLDKELPVSRNIDRLLFSANAPLRTEYEFLFRSLFEDSASYRKVISALASKLKGMTRLELKAATKLEGGNLSKILRNLCSCDFLRQYLSIGKTERDAMYQLSDNFSLFHLRFVENGSGQDENYWTNNLTSGEKNSWAGYAFEQTCLHHLPQIKEKLGISGILSNCYTWNTRSFTDLDGTLWKGTQIDLLIDRRDDVINICEMKFASDEYVITQDYENKLRNRERIFREATNTKKATVHTFVTTYGVRHNMHSSIVQTEVKMDDLFNPDRK